MAIDGHGPEDIDDLDVTAAAAEEVAGGALRRSGDDDLDELEVER